jgi:hypothetical protein
MFDPTELGMVPSRTVPVSGSREALAASTSCPAIALAAFGIINAAAVAGGAWFGPVRLRSLLRLPRKDDLRMRSSLA